MSADQSEIEPLDSRHLVAGFDCGTPELTEWLQRYALTSHRSESARVYVVHRDFEVRGYFALSAGSVSRDALPVRQARGLGDYPVPVVILARLAVHTEDQGRGLGTLLLRDALLRTAHAADIIGARSLVIHAQDEDARRWYLARVEFDESPVDRLQLMLLMKDLRRAIEG